MLALASALALSVLGQEAPDRLRTAWPRLVEAWRMMEDYKGGESALDDPAVLAMGKLHAAFEAAGFLEGDLEFDRAALKQLFQARYKIKIERVVRPPGSGGGSVVQSGATFILEEDGATPAPTSFGFDTLLASVSKLAELRAKGLDHEDNVLEEVVVVRKSLKAFRLMADDTPAWLGRRLVTLSRALLSGDAYPEPAKASDDQARTIRAWIADLANDGLEIREAATRALLKDGEAARPFLREALKGQDAEVVSRVKLILGVGHRPWVEPGK